MALVPSPYKLWSFFTTNILGKSQKNLVESYVIFQYIVVAEIWDRAFPSPEPYAHFVEMLVEC